VENTPVPLTPDPMSLSPGTVVDLVVERPVAGGRMLARHGGQVVLVAGAIPGEGVRARVERANRRVAWAQTIDVIEASPDRRVPACDPACGGSFYAHIGYERQRQLKREVIVDAFRRIGRLELEDPLSVASSPERAYRLRARLHVRGRRAGFFREGSHTLCDAAATGQLHPDAPGAVGTLLSALEDRLADCDTILVAENVDASERVVHLEPRDGARFDDVRVSLDQVPGLTGVTTPRRGQIVTVAGSATVTDTAHTLFGPQSPIAASVTWTRQAASFFQANRFLLASLVRRVLEASPGEWSVDLYSGVGLFAVALAARGGQVVAVEGDRVSGSDLVFNAAPWRDRLHVVAASVEAFVRQPPKNRSPDVIVLDPPRTGVSVEALDALIGWHAPRLVYVSCDPPTLARDAARLVAGGYRLTSIDAFDLFPNTPHVETVTVFEQRPRPAWFDKLTTP
jgi:23S rRNA (uracil1939-C5)-methyltransferase